MVNVLWFNLVENGLCVSLKLNFIFFLHVLFVYFSIIFFVMVLEKFLFSHDLFTFKNDSVRIVPHVFSPPRNVIFWTNFWARSNSLFDIPSLLKQFYLQFIESKILPPFELTDQHNESTFGISGTSSITYLNTYRTCV